jgi:peptide-methionine (S)-S-oxide reductase
MKSRILLPLLLAAGIASVAAVAAQESDDKVRASDPPAAGDGLATAILAGGCFWCMEPPYDKLEGVVSTTSGYTGGKTAEPTYEEVSMGGTGHAEAVKVVYDPAKVGYAELLNIFWHNIDPLTANAQFCDHGSQYRSAIFYVNEEQERLARKSKQTLENSGWFDRPIVTEIAPASEFYPAEDYHQDYYEKNPLRYKFYRYTCGRDQRLEEVWGGHREPILSVGTEGATPQKAPNAKAKL